MRAQTAARHQVYDLERDHERLGALVRAGVPADRPWVATELKARLAAAAALLDDLRTLVTGPVDAGFWQALQTTRAEIRAAAGDVLGLVGGLALGGAPDTAASPLDGGFSRLAQQWLDGLRGQLRVDQPIVVVAGPALPPGTASTVVRVPFPGLGLWDLPLLARPVALLAVAERADTGPLAAEFEADAADLFGVAPGALPEHLRVVAADMVATVAAGPAYPIALLTRELDPAGPGWPQRIRAVRDVLARFDTGAAARGCAANLYRDVLAGFDALAAELLPGGLPAVAGHDLLYTRVVRPLAGHLLPVTDRTWQWAGAQCDSWFSHRGPPAVLDAGLSETVALNVFWRAKLAGAADDRLTEAGQDLLDGVRRIMPRPSRRLGAPGVVATRLWLLDREWAALRACLDNECVPVAARQAVRARFLRLLSEQRYHLDRVRGGPAPDWPQLAGLAERAVPVRREAREFLCGAMLVAAHLDRDQGPEAGVPAGTCALADRLLTDLTGRTGIGHGTHTVLGPEPMLETATGLMRVRLPDWSPWSLPLVVHEFGHLVARDTEAFTAWRARRVATVSAGGTPAEQTAARLEEHFADVLATYTAGPAFAAAMVLRHLEPVAAAAPRGSHPSHADRAAVILHVLRRMNDAEHAARGPGPFAGVISDLTTGWAGVLDSAGEDAGRAAAAVSTLADELADQVETYYRLGVAYLGRRWTWAARAAGMLRAGSPGLARLREQSGGNHDGLDLIDVLNVLWAARLAQAEPSRRLDAVARELVTEFCALHKANGVTP
ncbi:hypothetical protein AB0M02_35640 [Actinoplanes sp. NPDC051861]|uniref:hypothetical protein n=1 Tax=Actinoplanes sp. NPDC051861 TaxID=3155170 RepID=UPI00343DF027